MITSTVHTLSTTAELIASGVNATPTSKVSVLLSGGSADIYVGGEGVTTALGTLLSAGQALSIDLSHGDSLYAVAASGTPTIRVLTTHTGYVAP
jgi:hypothetical protein